MGLSDADVERQINHMMAFIDQEAEEKVDEIHAKAEEEFEIWKGKLVQQQRQKIMTFYERKFKQLDQQKRVQQSQLTNSIRLTILKCREDHIQLIVDEARGRLTEIHENKEKYSQLLSGLIAQGLIQILEDKVIVKCLEDDISIVQGAIPKAVAQLKSYTGRDIEVAVNTSEFLTPDTCGGVEMASFNGAIKVRNTLDSRLQLIVEQMMPEIRETLFGKNPNRKFFS